MTIKDSFRSLSRKVSNGAGTPTAFFLSVLTVVIWGILGPHFKYSDTWQLVINTGTTIVTFLMVFLIQNTQNRDSREIHLKLDELIRANKHARNSIIDLEKVSDEELQTLTKQLTALRDETNERLAQVEIRKKKRRSSSNSGTPLGQNAPPEDRS